MLMNAIHFSAHNFSAPKMRLKIVRPSQDGTGVPSYVNSFLRQCLVEIYHSQH
jgi:hypothetical protein